MGDITKEINSRWRAFWATPSNTVCSRRRVGSCAAAAEAWPLDLGMGATLTAKADDGTLIT